MPFSFFNLEMESFYLEKRVLYVLLRSFYGKQWIVAEKNKWV